MILRIHQSRGGFLGGGSGGRKERWTFRWSNWTWVGSQLPRRMHDICVVMFVHQRTTHTLLTMLHQSLRIWWCCSKIVLLWDPFRSPTYINVRSSSICLEYYFRNSWKKKNQLNLDIGRSLSRFFAQFSDPKLSKESINLLPIFRLSLFFCRDP